MSFIRSPPRSAVQGFGEGAVACSPLPFEVGQVALENLLRALKHQQKLVRCFSVAAAFLKLFEVLSLPGD